jgi:hypothetical protein
VGEVKRFPEKPSMPISEEEEEREFTEACRADVLHKKTSKTALAFAEEVKQSHRRQKRTYRKLPESWAVRLRKAKRTATLKLANHLLACDWDRYGRPFAEGMPIVLTNEWLEENDLPRREKWHAVHEMVELGLVSAEFRARKSPIIVHGSQGNPSQSSSRRALRGQPGRRRCCRPRQRYFR